MIALLLMVWGRSLRQTGYAVDWVVNGADADNALMAGTYDLVILDVGLLKVPGLDVLRRLRTHKSQVLVLILTVLDGTTDRVKGLDLRADDYMAKSFELPELEARMRALTRRSTSSTPVIQFGSLAFDKTDRCALVEPGLFISPGF